MAITHIVFDLGGVLIDWDPRYLYRKLIDDDEEMETFFAEVCTASWNAQQDRGRSLAEATTELVQRFPEKEALIRAFYDRWEEMLGGPIEGTVQILSEVREAGYPLSALSDWSAETFPIAYRRYEFLSWFEPLVISGRVKAAKPDMIMYRTVLEKIGRPSADCLFIDDREYNVAGAKGAGMASIQFFSPERLREDLEKLGVTL